MLLYSFRNDSLVVIKIVFNKKEDYYFIVESKIKGNWIFRKVIYLEIKQYSSATQFCMK